MFSDNEQIYIVYDAKNIGVTLQPIILDRARTIALLNSLETMGLIEEDICWGEQHAGIKGTQLLSDSRT